MAAKLDTRAPPLRPTRAIRAILTMLAHSPFTTLSLLLPLLAYSASLVLGNGETPVCLSPGFRILLDEHTAGLPLPHDLKAAVKRTEMALKDHGHAYLSPTAGREFFSKRKDNSTEDLAACEHVLTALHLALDPNVLGGAKAIPSILSSAVAPAESRPELEAYRLSVPLDGPATISAKTALGLFRGLTTFEQLWYSVPISHPSEHGSSGTSYTVLSRPDSLAASQQLPLGSSGSQGPAKTSTLPPQMLDAMAMVKLNVFHWHITDSNSPHQKYSEDEVRMIVQYAGERGIDVVLEIDTPGHTAIVAESHPDLVACYERTPFNTYAHQPPAGQLRFADPRVADFVSGVFTASAGLSGSRYFSTGGDELNVACMMEDEPTTELLDRNGWTLDEALDDFTRKTHATLIGLGKTPLVWQEMVLDHGPMWSLSRDTIVDIWKDSRDARAVLDRGYKIVHAPADYFYLDCGQGGWIAKEGGGNSWCDPFKSWARMYSFNPYENVDEAQKELVIGGQASLWAEQTDETNFETVMWPRAAAVAELFWTGSSGGRFPRSSVEALPRMHDIRYRMVESGVRAVPLQPYWCALRPGACVEGK
ncbi:N-acetyl-glucosamine-6-phosphate deacetylase [Saitozyma podzolica]|uniref:beta-N-acetylhexosaminidase n=1 Tax=Saitozyma podzolica TaxID=1890683 RepID=A0A427YWE0_9TREE|nr:N-acetyl-glucosamine-6-phosphate deacetylase [Saitozyma podzolica]